MSRTRIGDFLEDEGQRLAYVFDPDSKRFFLMELTENVFGRTEKKAFVNRRHGLAPLQTPSNALLRGRNKEHEASFSREDAEAPDTEPLDEDFYGDEGFENEELDLEGYEIEE